MKKNQMRGWMAMAVLGLAMMPGARADGGGGAPGPANGGPFPAPELVRLPSDEIFAPPGFDDNDNAQVVVHGQLLNTCYKAAPPMVTVDRAQRLITVAPQAYHYESSWCLQVLTPFTQPVDLGLLPSGRYRVVEYNTVGRLIHDVTLPVAVSITSAPDEYLYAPVKHARIDLSAPRTLILSGTFSSDCLEMQEVKVMHRTPNVIEVLPIAAYKTGASCQPASIPFETQVQLPATEPGDNLIYVRSLNGQAISLVETF